MKKALITIEVQVTDHCNHEPADMLPIGYDLANGGCMVVTAHGSELGIVSAKVVKIEELEK